MEAESVGANKISPEDFWGNLTYHQTVPNHSNDEGSSPNDTVDDVNRGEEGTMSLAERERRKSKRRTTIIEQIDAEQVVIYTADGSGEPGDLSLKVDWLLRRHYGKIRELLRLLVVLAGLVVVALLLWRAGSILRIGQLIP